MTDSPPPSWYEPPADHVCSYADEELECQDPGDPKGGVIENALGENDYACPCACHGPHQGRMDAMDAYKAAKES